MLAEWIDGNCGGFYTEKGLPTPFIKMLKIGHSNNRLSSKISGRYSELVKNNI